MRIIENPLHPYARDLVASIPVPDPDHRWSELIEVPEDNEVTRRTLSPRPTYVEVEPGHWVAEL